MGSNRVLDLTVVRVPAGPRPSPSTSVLLSASQKLTLFQAIELYSLSNYVQNWLCTRHKCLLFLVVGQPPSQLLHRSRPLVTSHICFVISFLCVFLF